MLLPRWLDGTSAQNTSLEVINISNYNLIWASAMLCYLDLDFFVKGSELPLFFYYFVQFPEVHLSCYQDFTYKTSLF